MTHADLTTHTADGCGGGKTERCNLALLPAEALLGRALAAQRRPVELALHCCLLPAPPPPPLCAGSPLCSPEMMSSRSNVQMPMTLVATRSGAAAKARAPAARPMHTIDVPANRARLLLPPVRRRVVDVRHAPLRRLPCPGLISALRMCSTGTSHRPTACTTVVLPHRHWCAVGRCDMRFPPRLGGKRDG